MAKDLEQRMVSSIKRIVCEAIDSLKVQVEAKMHNLSKEVEALILRVRELEKAQCSGCRSSLPSGQISPKTVSQSNVSTDYSVCNDQSDAESEAEKSYVYSNLKYILYLHNNRNCWKRKSWKGGDVT